MNVSRLPSAAHPRSAATGWGCWRRFLSCGNFSFLRTREGIVKLFAIILGVVCQNLLISSDLTYSLSLGSSYYSFLLAASSGTMTSVTLLLTYIMSSKSIQLVRQSYFEIIFGGIVCFLYISSSCYLAFAVHTFLYPIYKITSLFQIFPAMSITYITGFLVGFLHGYDGWLAYKKYH